MSKLIAFEGIDGTGKSTLAARLAARLRQDGLEVVETREPSRSTAAGKKLHELFAQDDRTASAAEELELFHADREEHVRETVRPALARGAWVVQDRTFWSTAAYQGARGIPVDSILERSLEIAPKPDLTILLTLRPGRALERIAKGRERASSFEKLDSLEQVARAYEELAASERSFAVIDADREIEQVEEAVVAACRAKLGRPK